MKKFLKGTSLFLSSLIFLTVSISSSSIKTVDAATNYVGSTNTRENINILSSDLDNLVYTYTENGKEFKVVESLNENLTEVISEVLVKNEEGIYELQSEIETTVSNGEMIIETNTNNRKNIEVVELSTAVNYTPEINIKNELSTQIDPLGTIKGNSSIDQIQPFGIIEENGLTEWRYAGVFKYSNNIYKYTLGAIVAVIAGVSIPALAAAAGVTLGAAAKTTISYIANNLFSSNWNTIYYTQTVYYKYLIGTNPLLPRAEKTYTTVYKDSARTQKVGNTVIDEYWE